MQSLFTPVQPRETLSGHVLLQIKELLLTGKVMPGEQLSLRSTAEALQVSVMPVREAVNQLIADQALEIAPNRSIRVPQMSAEQFKEITDIRLQIEGFAVERAAAAASAALIHRLRDLNDELAAEMAKPGDKSAVVLLNKDLHFSIYEAAAMPMLTKIIDTLWLRIGPVLNYDLRSGSERTKKKIAVAYHANLINSLEVGDAAAAREALHGDIQSSFRYILAKHYS
jgi:DNA-binding GntR family transcriptional regulator